MDNVVPIGAVYYGDIPSERVAETITRHCWDDVVAVGLVNGHLQIACAPSDGAKVLFLLEAARDVIKRDLLESISPTTPTPEGRRG